MGLGCEATSPAARAVASISFVASVIMLMASPAEWSTVGSRTAIKLRRKVRGEATSRILHQRPLCSRNRIVSVVVDRNGSFAVARPRPDGVHLHEWT